MELKPKCVPFFSIVTGAYDHQDQSTTSYSDLLDGLHNSGLLICTSRRLLPAKSGIDGKFCIDRQNKIHLLWRIDIP